MSPFFILNRLAQTVTWQTCAQQVLGILVATPAVHTEVFHGFICPFLGKWLSALI
jgi:hypothetical protein